MLECWGKSKHEHRRVNDCVGKHLHRDIKSSLTTEGDNAVLPLVEEGEEVCKESQGSQGGAQKGRLRQLE